MRTREIVGAPTGWRAALNSRPRVALALKAAVAAAITWLCLQPLGGVADDYPYYAPLGAVVAVTSTFASSVRSTAQTVAAIACGAALAATELLLPLPSYAALAAVVGAGTLIGGWRRLGEMGSWVPVSGLFVLIVGSGDPAYYVAGYLGLTSLGAVIGVLVNGAFPPLPLTSNSITLRRLRSLLADQLDDLADGLWQAEPPRAEDWESRRLHLAPHVAEMHRVSQEVAESRRGNWRARRWQATADLQDQHARTLGQLSTLVEEIVDLVIARECADAPEVALGPAMRPLTAATLEATAALLRARPGQDAWQEAYDDLSERIEAMRSATRAAWRERNEDMFTAAAIVVDLERAAQSLHETGVAHVDAQASSD